jgi:hypothetical protein
MLKTAIMQTVSRGTFGQPMTALDLIADWSLREIKFSATD